MKIKFLTLLLLLSSGVIEAQIVTTDPLFPKADEPVTITVDVTGTSLDGFAWNNSSNPVYIWTWIDNASGDADAPTNIDPATSAADAAKCTRISTNPDKYQITFTPSTFFGKPASEISKIGLKLKSKSWDDRKQTDTDRFVSFTQGFAIVLSNPQDEMMFVNAGSSISVEGGGSAATTFTLKVNGEAIETTPNPSTTFDFDYVVSSTGTYHVAVEGTFQGTTAKDEFRFVVRETAVSQKRPVGVIDGINYNSAEATSATLCLLAPGKTSVYVVGDFNDWTISSDYHMKKDGEHFWLTIDDLSPGVEYGFQYLVDEEIYLADPYADKILDPNDQYIPASSYPNLKLYPAQALHEDERFNRVAVLQTNQQPYEWQTEDYQKPKKEELVIYELLIRDLFGTNARTYKSLIDTLGYFKRLGVNAIQLMPIMEFNGNESWGYNPTFMLAPDKYYGTKDKLKELVDKAHENGIAVILDIALNHQDTPNPLVLLDFNFSTSQPNPTNKWFNVSAKHPYNVFYDMNHESTYTKNYVDTVAHYWLNEFKVDGFRFDLSKGFTQNTVCNGSTSDEACFGVKDDSRIAILKRMANEIWSHSPDAYVILEHFAQDAEEIELSNHGMMLWGNMNHVYNQNTKGYGDNADISRIYYKNRNWTVPNLIGYMESHDEERLMYQNINYGNFQGKYNVKDVTTSLKRMRAANTMFLTIPGPKMIWQFGELGYQESINRCADGTINNDCRLTVKPVRWSFQDDADRAKLFDHISDLLRLRKEYDVFREGTATILGGSSLSKQITLKNSPYTTAPSTAAEMNVQIVANFDVTAKDIAVSFPHTGVWYEYYRGGLPFEITDANSAKISFSPGEYMLFTDIKIEAPPLSVTGSEEVSTFYSVYPNPVNDILIVDGHNTPEEVRFVSIQGAVTNLAKVSAHAWSTGALKAGLYIAELVYKHKVERVKIIKAH
ncbi:alpha-amylase family glycosyl hydrolase [Pseudochryseolinea flava]|uniref:Alpha-amylase n=1 Tax=Pseudochryseolinea flava TaxID=2059302 RepID=A0A364Y4F7_9BACT|nr:alpha-amylase family glycosyl hydrolase [Pseudochryseolinea flava]RAW01214.1 alpha-amylase [Pseudochryseolinea flava]